MARWSRAASGGHPPWDWRERSCRGTAFASRPRSQIAGVSHPTWRPEKLSSVHDPHHALQKSGGLADQWYMDDGDIVRHPILVLPFLQDFDVANARVGAEWNPLKNRSHLLREPSGCSATRVENW